MSEKQKTNEKVGGELKKKPYSKHEKKNLSRNTHRKIKFATHKVDPHAFE